jgi:hypothetical protein
LGFGQKIGNLISIFWHGSSERRILHKYLQPIAKLEFPYRMEINTVEINGTVRMYITKRVPFLFLTRLTLNLTSGPIEIARGRVRETQVWHDAQHTTNNNPITLINITQAHKHVLTKHHHHSTAQHVSLSRNAHNTQRAQHATRNVPHNTITTAALIATAQNSTTHRRNT